MKKRDVLIGGLIILVAIGCLFLAGYFSWLGTQQIWSTIHKVENEGFEVVQGIVKSPAVIIELDTLDEFIAKAKELKVTTVYYVVEDCDLFGSCRTRLYVFNENYTIAWRIDIPE